jgi:hypothetical protein
MKGLILWAGAATTTNGNNSLDKRFIWNMLDQVAEIMDEGCCVAGVFSGSIASCPYTDTSLPVRSAEGNVYLIDQLFQCMVKTHEKRFIPYSLSEEDFNPLAVSGMLEAMQKGIFLHINARDYADDEEINAMSIGIDNLSLFKKMCLHLRPEMAIVIRGRTMLARSIAYQTVVETLNELAGCGIYPVIVPSQERNYILRAYKKEENFGKLIRSE